MEWSSNALCCAVAVKLVCLPAFGGPLASSPLSLFEMISFGKWTIFGLVHNDIEHYSDWAGLWKQYKICVQYKSNNDWCKSIDWSTVSIFSPGSFQMHLLSIECQCWEAFLGYLLGNCHSAPAQKIAPVRAVNKGTLRLSVKCMPLVAVLVCQFRTQNCTFQLRKAIGTQNSLAYPENGYSETAFRDKYILAQWCS